MSYSLGFKLVSIALVCIGSGLRAQQLVNPQNAGDEIDRINALHRFAESNIKSNTRLALDFVKTAMDAAQKNNYEYGIAKSYFILGKIYGSELQNFELGIRNFEKAIVIAQKLDSVELLSSSYFYEGKLNYELGQYAISLKQFQSSLKLFRLKHDQLNESIAKIHIASIYSEWGGIPYDTAISYYSNSLRLAAQFKNDYLQIYTLYLYTTSLIEHKDFKEAEKYLDQAIHLTEKEGSPVGMTYKFYANLGEVYLNKGSFEKALEYFDKAKLLCEKEGIKQGCADVMLGLAKVYSDMEDDKKAQAYYQEALNIFKDLKIKPKIVATYRALATSAIASNHFERAYEYRSLQLIYSDSISKSQQQNLVQEVSSNWLRRSSADVMALQRKDAHINGLYITLLIVLIIVFIFLGLLRLNHQHLLTAKERSQLVNEKKLLQKQLETQKLEDEKLKHQLEYNGKILTANTLNLIQKNEILEKIKKKADEIRNASSVDLPSRISNLMQAVNFALNVDKDWENFSIHFEQVHNDFFNQLKAKFPSLNSNDLKLCALLKLNLDTKQIATVMDISPESVKVARSRLRKKLQLDQSENLSSFITYI